MRAISPEPATPAGSWAPRPSTDNDAISRRFASAYDTQLGFLRGQALAEETRVDVDMQQFRHTAWQAQTAAMHHSTHAESTRRALNESAASAWAVRESLHAALASLNHEEASLAASHSRWRGEEMAIANAQDLARQELDELRSCHHTVSERHRARQAQSSELNNELRAANEELAIETRIERQAHEEARICDVARDRARLELSEREAEGRRTVMQAMEDLEKEFRKKRILFADSDRRTEARAQELETVLDGSGWRAAAAAWRLEAEARSRKNGISGILAHLDTL